MPPCHITAVLPGNLVQSRPQIRGQALSWPAHDWPVDGSAAPGHRCRFQASPPKRRDPFHPTSHAPCSSKPRSTPGGHDSDQGKHRRHDYASRTSFPIAIHTTILSNRKEGQNSEEHQDHGDKHRRRYRPGFHALVLAASNGSSCSESSSRPAAAENCNNPGQGDR